MSVEWNRDEITLTFREMVSPLGLYYLFNVEDKTENLLRQKQYRLIINKKMNSIADSAAKFMSNSEK